MIVLVVISAATTAFVWRLANGPVSLAFLSPLLKQTLSFDKAGFRAEIDDTVLTWGGWQRTLDIRVRGVRIFDARGEGVGSLPELSVELSARALLRGMIAPTALELFGPRASLVRTVDGRITLGDIGANGRDSRAGAIIAALVAELARPPDDQRALGYLSELGISSAEIFLADDLTGKYWTVPKADLVMARGETGITGSARAAIVASGRTLRVVARGGFDSANRESTLEIDFADFDPTVLKGEAGVLDELAGLECPINGTVRLELGQGGKLKTVGLELDAAAGRIRHPRFFPDPVPVDGISLSVAFDTDTRRLAVDSLYLALGDGTIEGQGAIDLHDDGPPAIKFFADVRSLTAEHAKRYWPETLAPNAHEWVVRNLAAGRFPEGNVQVNITPEMFEMPKLPAEAVDFRFRFEGVSARYLRHFPLVTGGRGVARLTTHFLDLTVHGARTGNVEVTGGRMLFDQIHLKGRQQGDVDVRLRGALADVLALLDHKPLTFIQRSKINPARAHGETVTSANFKFPLRKGNKLSDFTFSTNTTLTGGSIEGLLKKLEIANGELEIEIEDNRLEARGAITLNGVPANIIWTENLLRRDGTPTRYQLQATLEPEQLTVLGLPGEGFIEGPVYSEVDLIGAGANISKGVARFDLRDARTASKEIGWLKPAGDDGGASFHLHTEDKRLVIDDFALSAGGLDATGNLRLDENYGLSSLNITALTLGETSLGLHARPSDTTGLELAIEGHSFDARPLIHTLLQDSGGGRKLLAFDATVAVDRVVTDDGVTLKAVTGTARHVDGTWDHAAFKGSFEAGGDLEISFGHADKGRQLSVISDDAGSVVRGLGVYGNAVGGSLSLEAGFGEAGSDSPVLGELKVEDFRIVNAPVLARVLTLGSLTGIGNLLEGDGISFKRLAVPFRLADGVLAIEDGRAHGAAIGFTIDGEVDNNRGVMDLDGAIIPAYTLNSLLAKVPIVGLILGGPDGEGVFAFTYRVSGARDDPNIAVNPLAVLAPGFLRGIFSGGRRPRTEPPEVEVPPKP